LVRRELLFHKSGKEIQAMNLKEHIQSKVYYLNISKLLSDK
jgi:hypothetical protein